jgi:hypothetical protein
LLTALALTALHAAAPPQAAAVDPSYLMKERILLLQGYIDRQAARGYWHFPKTAWVRPGGQLRVTLWPLDPWTGGYMTPGTGPGHYVYRVAGDRRSYWLTGYFQGGAMTVTGAVPFTYMQACDHRSMEGVCLVQQYLERWASSHSGSYPPASTVTRHGGVGTQSFMRFWPSNPWNHGPMAQSSQEGDFTYSRSDDDQRYKMSVHLRHGTTWSVSGSSATNPCHKLRLQLSDALVKSSLHVLQGYIEAYRDDHGSAAPAPADVSKTGALGQANSYWPNNPYSDLPMADGTAAGSFTYVLHDDGTYSLTGHLSKGDYTLP